MSLRTNLRTYLGLESIDVDINIGQAGSQSELDHPMVSAVASSGAMTPEAAEVEVQESAAEVEVSATEVEEIEEDVSALESYYNILERSLDNNGINTVSAEMLNVGLDKILTKYNVKATEIVPALEDYSNNAYSTTRVSMEKVGEAINSMKTAAVETLKKLWEAIVNFFRNIAIKLVPAVKMRLNMIKKHAASYKPTGGVKIKLTGKTADVISGIKGSIKGEIEQFSKESQSTAAQLQILSSMLEGSIGKDLSVDKAEAILTKMASSGIMSGSSNRDEQATKVYTKNTYLGNYIHRVVVPKVPDYYISPPSIKFGETNPDKDPVEEYEIDSLKQSDINVIVDAALILLNNVEQYSKHLSTRSKLTNWVKSLRKDEQVKDHNKKVTACIKAVGLGYKSLAEYILVVVKAMTEVCAKSVKATSNKEGDDKTTPTDNKTNKPEPLTLDAPK